MPAPVRPSLLERLQQQVVKLEREADYLRQLDRSMTTRLHAAVAEADRLQKNNASQAESLRELRRQLDARTIELELVRAELAAEKAHPSTPVASPSEPSTAADKPKEKTRWNNLEID